MAEHAHRGFASYAEPRIVNTHHERIAIAENSHCGALADAHLAQARRFTALARETQHARALAATSTAQCGTVRLMQLVFELLLTLVFCLARTVDLRFAPRQNHRKLDSFALLRPVRRRRILIPIKLLGFGYYYRSVIWSCRQAFR